MKKILSVVIAIGVLMISVNSFAASKFGAIDPKKEGSFNVGVEAFQFSDKVKSDKTDFDSFKPEQTQMSIKGEYSLTDKLQVACNIGAANLKIENAFEGDPEIGIKAEDFKDSYSPFVSLGLKGIIAEKDNLSLGAFIQTSFYSKYNDERPASMSWSEDYYYYNVDCNVSAIEKVTIKDQWDGSLGLTGQMKFKDAMIYAGPFLYMSTAKIDYEVSGTYTESVNVYGYSYSYSEKFSESDSADYKSKTNIGGFIGANVNLGQDFVLEGEAQFRSEPSFGISLAKTF